MKKALFILIIFSIILGGCASLSPEETLQNQAEQAANNFFSLLNTENYDLAYNYLFPSLQAQRNKSDFITFIETAQSNNKLNFVYDYIVVQNENLAYVYYYTSDENDLVRKDYTLELNNINGTWKINGMEKYIKSSCILDDCAAELTPFLIKSFIERCLDAGFDYDQCKYLAERDYEKINYTCDKSTGYKCYAAE